MSDNQRFSKGIDYDKAQEVIIHIKGYKQIKLYMEFGDSATPRTEDGWLDVDRANGNSESYSLTKIKEIVK